MHKPIVRILIAVLFSVLPSPKQVIGERRAVMPRGAAEKSRCAFFHAPTISSNGTATKPAKNKDETFLDAADHL
jgi:hypothetical protein